MTHQIKKRATGVPVKHAGFHKIFVDWQSSGNYDAPSKNQDDFYKEVEEEAQELIDKFEKGEITEEELRDKLNEIADGIMESDYDEAGATVYYGDSDEPHTIGTYHDFTDGDFDVKWKSTDAWRGYYDVVPSKGWKALHSDVILAYSEDAENLEKMDKELQDEMNERGIKYARVFTRTSNVFSSGLDTFVEAGHVKEVEGLAKKLAKKYRNPEDFELTALTGANPSEATKQDKMLVEAVHELKKGSTPEQAVKKVLKRHG